MFLISLLFIGWVSAQDCVTCGVSKTQNFESIFASDFDDIKQIAGCSIIPVGGMTVHNQIGHVQNKIPNNSQFVLRRPKEKQWEVEFNAVFKPTAGTNATDAQSIRARVEKCFAQASPYIVGPNGHSIALKLKPAGTPELAPKIEIAVVPTGRGNANTFSKTFGCPAIIHEFMHHAGLCDEYPETDTSITNAASCRVIVKDDSIMGPDMEAVYNASVGSTQECHLDKKSLWLDVPTKILTIAMTKSAGEVFNLPKYQNVVEANWCQNVDSAAPPVDRHEMIASGSANAWKIQYPVLYLGKTTPQMREINCSCPPSNASCVQAITEMKNDIALIYGEQKEYRCPYGSKFSFSSRVSDGFGLTDDRANGVVVYRNRPQGRSVLHPSHFTRIMRGSCRSADKQTLYDICAQYAYKHSQPDNLNTKCTTVPKECYDPKLYLGGSPVKIPSTLSP